MNEKTTKQIEEMKKQTIGVEVEMNSITRKNAATIAAGFFGTNRVEDTASRNGYYTWSAWDQSGREWKFQRDVSISGPDSEKCEMVTPILTYEDMDTLQELVRLLRKAGAKSDPTRGCGVHIHIGANGHTPASLRNLANIMIKCAEELNIKLCKGVYCYTKGPQYETPAEIRMLKTLGVGAVGMSTVPEAIVATHCGIKVVAVSCITNMAAGILPNKLTHEEVIENAGKASNNSCNLVKSFISKI